MFAGAGASAIGNAAPLTFKLLERAPYFDGSSKRLYREEEIRKAWFRRRAEGDVSVEQWFSELWQGDPYLFYHVQSYIAHVLVQAMDRSSSPGRKYGGVGLYRTTRIPEQERLWETLCRISALSVITTNYDVVIERALRLPATKRRPSFHYIYRREELNGVTWPAPGRHLVAEGKVGLRKLHGSLSWERLSSGVVAKWLDCRPAVLGRAFIVPPVREKATPPLGLQPVWEAAAADLRAAANVIVIGYSAPAYDLAARELLVRNVAGDAIIEVFDPNPKVAETYTELLPGRAIRWRGPLPQEHEALVRIVDGLAPPAR